VGNAEGLAVQGPVVFAFNHSTYFETLFAVLVLYHLRQERVGFMVDWMFGRWPILGALLGKVDPVYVWNKKSRFAWLNRRKGPGPERTAWEEALGRLREGRSLALFPEGKAHPSLLAGRKGRAGVGHLVLAAGVRVVPVGISFPGRDTSGRAPRFGRIRFQAGPPLAFPELGLAYRASEDPRARAALAREAAERVMVALSVLAFEGPAAPAEGLSPGARRRPARPWAGATPTVP
jgi:1-acyl-sn-glycerol-3-phosphate acyltransferase